MNISALADHLQSLGIGTVGVDLFVYAMAEDVKIGTLLLDKMTGTPIDPEIPGYRPYGGFQAIVRHSLYGPGFAKIEEVKAALTLGNVLVGNMHINYCRPRHEPVVFPRSAGNSLEFSVNFDANYVI